MPPTKSIIVDPIAILSRIAAIADKHIAAASARAEEARAWQLVPEHYPFAPYDWDERFVPGIRHRRVSPERAQELADEAYAKTLAEHLPLAPWVSRDLEFLAGRTLTASERKRYQQTLKRLSDDGLVVCDPRWVRITDSGRKHAKLQGAVDG